MNKRNFLSLLFSVALFCFFSSNAIQFKSGLNIMQLKDMRNNFKAVTGTQWDKNTAVSNLQNGIIKLINNGADITPLQNFMTYVAQINWGSGFSTSFSTAAAHNSDSANRIKAVLGTAGVGLNVPAQVHSAPQPSSPRNTSVRADNLGRDQVKEAIDGIFAWLSQCSVQDLAPQNIVDQRKNWLRHFGLEEE